MTATDRDLRTEDDILPASCAHCGREVDPPGSRCSGCEILFGPVVVGELLPTVDEPPQLET